MHNALLRLHACQMQAIQEHSVFCAGAPFLNFHGMPPASGYTLHSGSAALVSSPKQRQNRAGCGGRPPDACSELG
jgi:hypothetical protein